MRMRSIPPPSVLIVPPYRDGPPCVDATARPELRRKSECYAGLPRFGLLVSAGGLRHRPGAAPRLRLAALEVFPHRRRKPFLPRRAGPGLAVDGARIGTFAGFAHAASSLNRARRASSTLRGTARTRLRRV